MKKTMLALAILLQGVSALSAVGPLETAIQKDKKIVQLRQQIAALSHEGINKDTKIHLLEKSIQSLKHGLDACHAREKNYQGMHDDCLPSVERLKAQARAERAEVNRLRAQLAGGEGGGH